MTQIKMQEVHQSVVTCDTLSLLSEIKSERQSVHTMATDGAAVSPKSTLTGRCAGVWEQTKVSVVASLTQVISRSSLLDTLMCWVFVLL